VTFLAPGRLWLLAVVVALVAGYLLLQIQRRRYVRRFTNPELLGSVAPWRPGRRRHIPALAFALVLSSLVLGFAKPARSVKVAKREATVVLAIDTSDSMAAKDVTPSRIKAAQKAADDFTADLPKGVKLGLISFGPNAQVLVTPTNNRLAVRDGLRDLPLSPGTATGEAILAALGLIPRPQTAAGSTSTQRPAARIVVLSDGVTNRGRPIGTAIRAAIARRIPVSTIAYGTERGTIVVDDRTIEVPVDQSALRTIAQQTKGRFYEAATGAQLRKVYEDVGAQVGVVTQHRDLTRWFTGLALLLAFAGGATALLWTERLL
jgi:Ca-activated chloride channel family protein